VACSRNSESARLTAALSVDANLSAFANALKMAIPSLHPAMQDQGIELYELDFPFLLKNSRALVVRSDVRALWAEVMKVLVGPIDAEPRVLIKGPAGVGKSVSVLYGLKLLLEQGRVVVLETQPTDTAYLFRPGPHGYTVSAARRFRAEPPAQAFEDALSDPDAAYLVDPGQAGVSPEPLPCRARTVLASSPDERHYKEWYKNAGRGGVTIYASAWKEAELQAVRPLVCPGLSDQDFADRVHDFGGVLRPLVASQRDVVSVWGRKQELALQGETIARVAAFGLMDSTRTDEPPPTSVFCYVPFNNFLDHDVAPISSYAASAIALNHWSKVEEAAAGRLRWESSMWGALWERALVQAVADGGRFVVRDVLAKGRGPGRSAKGRRPGRPAGEDKLQQPPAVDAKSDTLLLPRRPVRTVAGDWDAFEAAVAASDGSALLVPEAVNQPAVDAADGPRRAFQMTLSASHKVTNQLASLLAKCQLRDGEVFEVFFVVPKAVFDSFSVTMDVPDARVRLRVLRLSDDHGPAEPRSYNRSAVQQRPR
jgi:hypothetical protein